MSKPLSFTPSFIRWAFFMIGCLITAGLNADAGPKSRSIRMPQSFLQVGEPDQEKGREILESFRGMSIPGDYYLQFELKVRPRRGDELSFPGHLWGSRNYQGPVNRIVLSDNSGQGHRYLLQNGPNSKAWTWDSEGGVIHDANAANLFAPLIPQTELTLFDLQMPYLYWSEFYFEGTTKLLGRIAHVFVLTPPQEWNTDDSPMKAVRVYLDTQFHAMVKSEILDADGQSLKSMTVRDIKKIQDQWIVKTIDFRNELTRDKTRFQVTRAALDQDFMSQLFTPEALTREVTLPNDSVSLGP